MFQQNPHPIYTSFLENEYKILEVEKIRDTKWYELLCENHKIMIGIDSNTTHIYEFLGSQNIRYGKLPKFSSENEKRKTEVNISIVIDNLKSILAKSLDIKNIEFMKLIIFEIKNLYPQIERISFSKMDKNSKDLVTFKDQSDQSYEFKSNDIHDFINKFYFITNLQIASYINIKNLSNHKTLKSFEDSLALKKSLNLDFNIQKII